MPVVCVTATLDALAVALADRTAVEPDTLTIYAPAGMPAPLTGWPG